MSNIDLNEMKEEDLIKIIKNALNEGYRILQTEWMDEWEREEGCPSVCYELDDEDLEDFEEDVFMIFPEYTKNGCSELNFVKESEYIEFYHGEYGDEYISSDAMQFLV